MFEIKKIPFSRFGSFITISPNHQDDPDGPLFIRNIRNGDNDFGEVFRIDLICEGAPQLYTAVLHPSILRLESEKGIAEFCITEAKVLQIRSHGVGVRLTGITGAYDYAVKVENNRWEVNHSLQEIRYMLTSVKGSLEMDAPFIEQRCEKIVADFHPDPTSAEMECVIEEFSVVYQPRTYPDFREGHRSVETEYEQWLKNTLNTPEEYRRGHELASYITWSCVVSQEGMLPRPAMYMSKNWMTNIWSWDHCFNALALAKNSPKLAWDQFMTFFDLQDKSGMLPDFVNNRFALWNFTKPPIHGWTLRRICEQSDFFTLDKLQEVYEPLGKWTKWWLTFQDSDHDGIPQYNHGNDSGWDNSTIFHKGTPVESPDLSSFLVLQMEVLAEIAAKLGKKDEAEKWKQESHDLLTRMIDHFWDGSRFVAKRSGTHERIESDSLVLYIPVILGNRLPSEILTRLVEDIKNRGFLTPFGLATELPESSFYRHDGYWRGPIWAPTTLLIVDGLLSSGEKELALEIARRFCAMASKSGMAENYNALTGEGLRDPAFTWTSSVFLILANLLHNNRMF
ncbi:amylo-alpha-1,6-glucosidase [Neobacillus massiliamazoniensis]|jgi:glycogen debranching enzyme|uniref:Alpha-glucosidase n=1 Tax=Neobacillus massiliamazoniensis TaxID=1499688 RepID=A0A0U1NWR9_9BACI|nr:trehalase family glycosidase [Neobacillus massiliamazoniensis]CRK82308.1 alpha-glucosidase [Neobacillus massiliamazoniensis]